MLDYFRKTLSSTALNILARLSHGFRKLFSRTTSQQPESKLSLTVHDDESLSRMIYSRRHYAATKGASFALFLPRPVGGNFETSVFRTDGLDKVAVKSFGHLTTRTQALKGWVNLFAREIRNCELSVVSTPQSHIRHADIVDWPMEESARHLKALELAKLATVQRLVILS